MSPKRKQESSSFRKTPSRLARWLGPELWRAIVYTLTFSLVLSQAPIASSQPGMQRIRVTATAISPTQVQLNWTITNPGSIATIRIYRANNVLMQNQEIVGSTPPSANSFTDVNLTPGATYFYQLRTVAPGVGAVSTPSNTASVTLSGADPAPTPTPTATPTVTPTPNPTPTPTPNPTPTPTPNPTPTPSPTPGPTATPSPMPTRTPRPSPTPNPTPTPTPNPTPTPVPTPTASPTPSPTPVPPPDPISIPTPVRIFYASPTGTASNDGSFDRPIDLATAISANSPARPGDAIYLRGGTYSVPGAKLSGTDQPPIVSRLTGTATAPIQLRQNPGDRAIINGGMRVEGAYTWYIDFEVTNSHPDRTLPRPTGMNVYGHHVKLINLIIHDCGDGIGFWQPAEDSEVYGAILYRNGWEGPSDFRGNGHGIYIQNRNGQKRIIDLLSFDNYATGMKAYTEQGYIIGIRFEGNISFNNGSSAMDRVSNNRLNNILAGAGINAADGIEWISNFTYHPLNSRGPSLQLGYTAENNKTGVIRDNYFVGGSTTLGYISRWENMEVTGNSFIGSGELLVINTPAGRTVANYNWNNNTYFSSNPNPIGYKPGSGEGRNYSLQEWQRTSGVDGGSRMLASKPTGSRVFVRPNRYAAGRAHIAVYNWDLRQTVDVDFSRFLRNGDRYEIRNAQDYFGAPAAAGTFNGRTIQLPMNTGAKSAPEFNAFVLISNSSGQPLAPPSTAAPERRPASKSRSISMTSSDSSIELAAAENISVSRLFDIEESRLLDLINEYRLAEGRNPLSPAISLTHASDWAARDMAARNYKSRNDSLGRSPRERARAFGFPTERAAVEEESLPAAGECTAAAVFDHWKSGEATRAILLDPNWKNLGLARTLNPQTGQWHWNVTFAAYWDKTLRLAGEDADGVIERTGLIRTRPPAESLLANHRFSGYGDNGQPYDPVHCDLDSPAQPCWRDPLPERDARLYGTSSSEAIAGDWRISTVILPSRALPGESSPDSVLGAPLEFEIHPDGGWTLRGHDLSRNSVSIESGTWTVRHNATRNEELITFHRASGMPPAVIRAHAVSGRLTFLAGDAAAILRNFFRDWPGGEPSADNPQFIFVRK